MNIPPKVMQQPMTLVPKEGVATEFLSSFIQFTFSGVTTDSVNATMIYQHHYCCPIQHAGELRHFFYLESRK